MHPLTRRLRWIYIGEPGTGAAPHVDPLATHAWMWQASGRKEWRIVRRDPLADALPAVGACLPGAPLDLFVPTVCDALVNWAQGQTESLESKNMLGSLPNWMAWAGKLNAG